MTNGNRRDFSQNRLYSGGNCKQKATAINYFIKNEIKKMKFEILKQRKEILKNLKKHFVFLFRFGIEAKIHLQSLKYLEMIWFCFAGCISLLRSGI